MPIYEYACAACGHQFEEWQKMSDAPVRTCPKCKKKKVERLISRTAFQLKGSGWYADLYSSAKPGQDAKGEKAESKSEGGEAKDSSASSKDSSGSADGSSKGAKSSNSSEKATATDSSSKKKKDSAKKAEPRAA
jgi:putative FmdB family regulatory protein